MHVPSLASCPETMSPLGRNAGSPRSKVHVVGVRGEMWVAVEGRIPKNTTAISFCPVVTVTTWPTTGGSKQSSGLGVALALQWSQGCP